MEIVRTPGIRNHGKEKTRMKIIVTGGAGFIGSALVRYLIKQTENHVLNLDKLTYAANLSSLQEVESNPRYAFKQVDICDKEQIRLILEEFQPDAIMHLAAESHVDRSIDSAEEFIKTNIIGTFNLLENATNYWRKKKKDSFKFHHISTDEVFGSLEKEGLFTEKTPYSPNSPYSASKASSDHLVRAWYHTYGLPTLITNCSNNYGPYHFPEKLIPLMIINAVEGKELPVYGKGENIRDWLYVEDHVRALYTVLTKGRIGETYNIGGNCEKQNLDVVHTICDTLDVLCPRADRESYRKQIKFVQDRPGHDLRYAIDASKIKNELGWQPTETFETGIQKTIQWYLDNSNWYKEIQKKNDTSQRLGLRVS